VFVHGELGLSLGTDLGARLKAVVKVIGGHVGARDQAAALLGDALEESSTLLQKALAVGGGAWGVG
jgi:hypothetical protein